MILTKTILLGILHFLTLFGNSQGGKHKSQCFPERTLYGKTYSLITEPGSYYHGKKACLKWDGQLALGPALDSEILKFVLEAFDFRQIYYPDLWLGKNEIENEGNSDAESKPENFQTIDSEDNFSTGNNKRAKCPSFKTKPNANKNGFKKDHCTKKKMSLCEKPFVNKDDSLPNDCCRPSVGSCSHGYATFDGSCNSRLDKFRGMRSRALKRLLPAAYDRETEPRGTKRKNLPSAREVTNAVRDLTSPNSSIANNMMLTFGQVITHDMTRSAMDSLICNCNSTNPDCFNIAIPAGDPMGNEFQCINFTRSRSIANVNCKTEHVREQENLETAYIDASFMYGSTADHANALRAPDSQPGKMLTGNFTTPNSESLPLESALIGSDLTVDCPVIHKPAGSECFATGDIRGNTQPVLLADHTAFLREHNRIVDQLQILNPAWNSDKLYQTARKIVGAILQQMAYGEFLPPILGPNLMRNFGLQLTEDGFYYGYNANYDSTISNEFSTAAFRLHTMVVDTSTFRDSNFDKVGDMPLASNFFSSVPFIMNDGTGKILRGAAIDEASKFDANLVTALTDKLFIQDGKTFGRDLNALNIQRGRDHGIASYFEYRKFCGLSEDLSDIPAAAQNKLHSVYLKNKYIDLFPGGNAENAVEGGIVGPTFGCLLAYQFRDLRRGDLRWFENGGSLRKFTQAQLRSIKRMTLARLICDTSASTTSVQPKVMLLPGPNNQKVNCSAIPELDLTPWKENAPFGNEHYNLMYSPWLPVKASSCGNKLPLAPAVPVLRQAAVYRPGAVCKQVLGHQMKKVSGHYRVRFACPAGSIMETDYPTVDAEYEYFTPWMNQYKSSKANGEDDIEPLSGYDVCRKPVAIQAQTTDGAPCLETGDIFEVLSPQHGLVCRGFQQASGRCKDYRVRYVCQKEFRG